MIERAASLRRGTVQHLQRSLQSFEVRSMGEQQPVFLKERLTRAKILRVLEDQLPGLVDKLHRQISAMVQIFRAGGALKDRIIPARRQQANLEESAELYWQRVAAKAKPRQQETGVQKQTQRHRLRW
jgi:hypothetical protein